MPKTNQIKFLLIILAILLLSSIILFDLLDHLYNLTPRTSTTLAEPLWNSLVGSGFRGGRVDSNITTSSIPQDLPDELFNFTESPPVWLNPPDPDPDSEFGARDPLVLRIAFISRPNEHDRRATIRQSILKNVPPTEIKFEYKFFVGLPFSKNDPSVWLEVEDQEEGVEERVHMEAAKYGDLAILDLGEGHLYMGEKRWMMFKWGAAADPSTYDFFLGADTDSFLRLAAITRRFHFLRPHSNPRTDKIIWAHMGTHIRHWTPAGGNRSAEDPFYDDEAKRYAYPYGMAYLLSSALVRNLTVGEGMDRLPHHVKYAGDDMMIGSWVWEFARDTDVLDDPQGFHDPPGYGWKEEPPIDYDTICIHHVSANEMQSLRARPEWALSREWDA